MIVIVGIVSLAAIVTILAISLCLMARGFEGLCNRHRDRKWREFLNGSRKGPAPDGLDDLGLR